MLNGKGKNGCNGHAVKYKGDFSLRDEISTCPNIKVENWCNRQITIFHKTLSCKGRRQDINRQRNFKL